MFRTAIVFVIGACVALASCGGGAVVDRDLSGFDDYGYNAQARQFDGYYFNNYADAAGFDPWAPNTDNDAAYLATNPGADAHWAWPYRTTRLKMKWNADWDAGNDVNWDPDQESVYEDAWLTNHMWDSYEDSGETYNWNWFTKIVWVGDPGPLWGQFQTIQDVYNDPHAGYHGNTPIPGPNGFGAY